MDPLSETWRQRRAVEHLRQQHERHTHIWPDDVPHSHPGDLPRHIHPAGAKHFRPRESLQIRTEEAREHLYLGKNEHFRQHSDSLRARNDDLREREARKQVGQKILFPLLCVFLYILILYYFKILILFYT